MQDIIKEDDLNNNSFKSRLSPIKKIEKIQKSEPTPKAATEPEVAKDPATEPKVATEPTKATKGTQARTKCKISSLKLHKNFRMKLKIKKKTLMKIYFLMITIHHFY